VPYLYAIITIDGCIKPTVLYGLIRRQKKAIFLSRLCQTLKNSSIQGFSYNNFGQDFYTLRIKRALLLY